MRLLVYGFLVWKESAYRIANYLMEENMVTGILMVLNRSEGKEGIEANRLFISHFLKCKYVEVYF